MAAVCWAAVLLADRAKAVQQQTVVSLLPLVPLGPQYSPTTLLKTKRTGVTLECIAVLQRLTR